MAMQGRTATTLAGAAVVGLLGWLVIRSYTTPRAAEEILVVDSGAVAAGDSAPSALSASADAGSTASRGDGGSLFLSDLLEPEPSERDDAGPPGALFDGGAVPPLPPGSPKQVRFGIVLVSYEGAEPSVGSSHPAKRSRQEARALAEKLLETAGQDFHAAVQQGDVGSSEDVGRVKLGILEPAPEYVLFTLPVKGVGGPVDTPRGYWIVKRLE